MQLIHYLRKNKSIDSMYTDKKISTLLNTTAAT